MIGRSNTSFSTTSGRADFVCQTEIDKSSDPRATTLQMFCVATGFVASRLKICGLYAYGISQWINIDIREILLPTLTDTSTVFSWPTSEILELHDDRDITAATKT